METGGVLLEEGLHLRHLQDALVIILYAVVPHTGAAFFHGSCDRVHVDDMVADLGHQLHQNDLVDAREHLRVHQIGDL